MTVKIMTRVNRARYRVDVNGPHTSYSLLQILLPGVTFSKLLRKILGRFLILRQSLTISGKTLTRHNFALHTNSRFNNNVT